MVRVGCKWCAIILTDPTLLIVLFVTAFAPMLGEAVVSRRHERQLRAAGATEPAGDVYALMQVIYPACFLGGMLEAVVRDRTAADLSVIGAALFAAAKALKYWAIATLGEHWTFRVLVPPRSQPTRRGPYRFMRHPNYVAVAAEIVGFSLLARAPVAGVAGFVVFGALMLARIRVEERALGRARG